MIQRKQSVFLLVAAILTIVCLCLPIGVFHPKNLGVDTAMYNLWIQYGNGSVSYTVCPLFCILLLATVTSFFTIFKFNNRKLQIKLCGWNNLLIVVWYIAYAVFAWMFKGELDADFKIGFISVLPLVSMILIFMARKAIKADEALIRAADRIR